MAGAIEDIRDERLRQMIEEGWTPAHDDELLHGELVRAAACYSMYQPTEYMPVGWPFSRESWKPKDRRRNLIRAAALLVAEIERIDRSASADDEQYTSTCNV